MGCDGMRWDGMEWDAMGCDGIEVQDPLACNNPESGPPKMYYVKRCPCTPMSETKVQSERSWCMIKLFSKVVFHVCVSIHVAWSSWTSGKEAAAFSLSDLHCCCCCLQTLMLV